MGGAKALLRDADGRSFVERGAAVLAQAGCSPVVVVVGAEREAVAPLAAAADQLVEAADWEKGQSASLRAGLAAAASTGADAACLLLVDLPDVGPDVVERVLAAVAVDGPAALGRAAYRGAPGHPVVIGRDHWAGVLEVADGDRGARDYLAVHDHVVVECGDLATGRDVDTAADL
jgi:CTP:molybdopterin cytidylyltransferase MocA